MAKSKCSGCEHWVLYKPSAWEYYAYGGGTYHYCDKYGVNRSKCDKFNDTIK